MTKYTGAKKDRIFESVPVKEEKTGKVVERVTIKRGKVLDVKQRSKKQCEHCGGEMMVAPGQIARFHRECRSEGRTK